MANLNLLVAFIAGFVTFFASCLAPLTPAFIAFLAGTTPKSFHSKSRLFFPTVFFVIGFILIFFIFGLTAGTIGNKFNNYRHIGNLIGGIFLVIFGVYVSGVIKIPIFSQEFRLPRFFHTNNLFLNAFFFGITFGFAWTPCVGPVLGSILLLATNSPSQAIPLLLAFGTGLSVPYLLLALGFTSISRLYMKSGKVGRVFQIISAVILVLMGISLITGKVSLITILVSRLLDLPTLTI